MQDLGKKVYGLNVRLRKLEVKYNLPLPTLIPPFQSAQYYNLLVNQLINIGRRVTILEQTTGISGNNSIRNQNITLKNIAMKINNFCVRIKNLEQL